MSGFLFPSKVGFDLNDNNECQSDVNAQAA